MIIFKYSDICYTPQVCPEGRRPQGTMTACIGSERYKVAKFHESLLPQLACWSNSSCQE